MARLVGNKKRDLSPGRALDGECLSRTILIVGLAVRVVATWTALLLIPVVVILVVALVLRVADGIATESAETSTDGRAFKATTALIADDAADSSATESTDDRARLGIWASGARGDADGSKEG